MDLQTAQTFNAAAFVLQNKIVNENGIPITFKRHKFLVDFYMDNSPRLVAKKCGQIGFSTAAIIRSFHLANYVGANVIYTLPSKPIIKDFVTPKVNPLISSNPIFGEMVGDVDSTGLKKIGDRFVYFRSSWDEASGISISAHILINDELDRSNQKAVRTYKTRLDAAALDRPDLGWWWKFSNPSIPGYGVDEDWQISDQKHWMIKCEHCNFWQYLKFPENINFKTAEYVCQKCEKHISDDTRIDGKWVKKYLGRNISGYWINQLMAAWIPASKIIEDSQGDQSVFYNFTLGEAHLNKDFVVTRESIVKCLYPTINPRTDVAIGVDNGIVKHYVVGNKYGIFMIGQTEDWQFIENLRNRFDAVMVIDANPYPTPAKKLVEKYRGKVFMHYYEEDRKQVGIIRFGETQNDYGIVKTDRTKIIDAVVADINAQDLLFNFSLTDLENLQYPQHWENMYRSVAESEKGIKKAVWITPEGRPDHYAHATVLMRAAQTKVLTSAGVVKPNAPGNRYPDTIIVNSDNTAAPPISLDQIKESIQRPKSKGWEYR